MVRARIAVSSRCLVNLVLISTSDVHAGRLDFVDNSLKGGSGTIHARAVVQNPDGFLKPGMMARLRLAATSPYQAMLVPDTAIVTDAARRVVYIVDRQGQLRHILAKPVGLDQLNEILVPLLKQPQP